MPLEVMPVGDSEEGPVKVEVDVAMLRGFEQEMHQAKTDMKAKDAEIATLKAELQQSGAGAEIAGLKLELQQ